ncbi:putative bacteriophage protein [Burkholderia pseudomallei]|nr:putative bacteriophage protein [Burkholderia pseudomallei]
MTTDNSRADALTILQELSKWAAGFSTWQDEPKGPYLSNIIADARRIVSASTSSQPAAAPIDDPTIPAELHHDTAKLVRRFARALANKLLAAQRKYGYSDNWMRDGWADECRAELMRHIQKGDPRDVAAYCAFLWHHNESTATTPAPAEERAAFVERVMGMFEAWPNGKPGPTDEPESHYRFGYNTALEDVLTALDVGSPTRRAASANETGAEGAIVGAWLTEDGRAISAEQKAGMLRDGGAGASSVQPYSIPCYLGAASAMAAEAVAFEITEQAAAEWASRHDVDHVLKHFSTQRNAIEDARTLHLLAVAPQPAQAGARVGLTDEQRDAIDFVIGWYEQSTIADNPYREHIAAMRALLSARPAESWQVEIDAYKREVRELEAVLRIPEKMEDDWIRADVQRPIEAGIPSDDDVLAWNNDPGFATIISASFISPSFPEYTHWKKKPEAPADIDHAKGVDHAE